MVIKKNKSSYTISLIIIFVIFQTFLSYGGNNLSREMMVRSTTMAKAPEEDKECLIFTYKSDFAVRYVGISFAHENFKKIYYYSKNDNSVFFLIYTIPYGHRELKYRLVVDGLWMRDPFNPLSEFDYEQGIDFSIIKLAYQREKEISNPGLEADNHKLVIVYLGESGNQVSLVGTFNSWDPYSHPLKEVKGKPGYYKISFTVGLGRHYYLLLVNGREIIDPYNYLRVYDREAKLLNYFDFFQ